MPTQPNAHTSPSGASFGGCCGGNCPPQASGCPPPASTCPPTSPKPQEVTAAGFPLFLPKFKCVITLTSHLALYCIFFFFFFFLWRRQGRSQGTLASNKKLFFKGSRALLELIFVPNFCWNTLLMWLQKAHEIAQNQKIFSRGLTAPPNPPCWLGSLRSPSRLCPPPPKKNLKWRSWSPSVSNPLLSWGGLRGSKLLP